MTENNLSKYEEAKHSAEKCMLYIVQNFEKIQGVNVVNVKYIFGGGKRIVLEAEVKECLKG